MFVAASARPAIASLAELVGEAGLEQVTHYMRRHAFDALLRSEAVRMSDFQFRLAIESFDDACGDGTHGQGPVEDRKSLEPQASGGFPHQCKPAEEGPCTPRLEELGGPCGSHVLPEPLELLAQQVGAGTLEVVLQQGCEPRGPIVRKILGPLQQGPAELGETLLVSVAAQLGDVLASYLTNRHVHAPLEVEAVEQVQGFENLFRDCLEVGPPHVAALETEFSVHTIGEHLDDSPQALLGAFLQDSEQSLDATDLVDKRHGRLANVLLDLVDTDRLYGREIPMGYPQTTASCTGRHTSRQAAVKVTAISIQDSRIALGARN